MATPLTPGSLTWATPAQLKAEVIVLKAEQSPETQVTTHCAADFSLRCAAKPDQQTEACWWADVPRRWYVRHVLPNLPCQYSQHLCRCKACLKEMAH